MAAGKKLELTWIGKDKEERVEPRILIYDKEKSYGDQNTGNMLIHGDNLLALKSLEQEYAGKVKCIYIDPPYNADAANEHYDDFVEHSKWLGLMRSRLMILRELLRQDGSIWIQINDEEQAYLKVMLDEIFGRNNFVNMISVNMKNIAGASGGGEDKRLKKNCEYILIYAKDYQQLERFRGAYDYTELSDLIQQYIENGVSWKYTTVLLDPGMREYIGSTVDGNGDDIKIYRRKNPIMKSIRQVAKLDGITEKEAYKKYGTRIFQTTNAQSSIRTRVMEYKYENDLNDDVISIQYIPKTGKNKGNVYEQFYKGDKCRLFVWLKDTSEEIDGVLYKKDLQGTYWDFTGYMKNLTKEGKVEFSKSKKPEHLIKRVFEMCTEEQDLVLDSFLGSGTTAAVAHKMNRRYIGLELEEHCYTHCKVRLDRVINGDSSGISKDVNWQGGGGYRFYELAPSLLKRDEHNMWVFDYDAYAPEQREVMIAEAIAKLNGYHYAPDAEVFWKQGISQPGSFIFTTMQYVSSTYLDTIWKSMNGDECLLVCCPAFDNGLGDRYDNIVMKKIPQTILDKCEFGREDYKINIIETTDEEDDEAEDDDDE